jgi:hypothetical protein
MNGSRLSDRREREENDEERQGPFRHHCSVEEPGEKCPGKASTDD